MPQSSFAELLQSLAQQVESMNMTVVAAVEAHRQESDDLEKKNRALQAALLAKASEADVPASSQVSVKPRSFADHLASDPVKLVVSDRAIYVHRSILSSIPFFEAKLEHWCDEPVSLPEGVSEPALDHLLMRLYVGAPLPVGSVALCAQIIHLAKYWLLDVIVTEMVAEVLRMVKKEDVPVLDEFAMRFGIDELSAGMEKLRKRSLCSSQDLEGIVSQALRTGQSHAQKLCTDMLKEHPEACHVLREQFTQHSFDEWSDEAYAGNLYCHVKLYPAFRWFWQELKSAGLLKTDLLFIARVLGFKLNQTTAYKILQFKRSDWLDQRLCTLASALELCGTTGDLVEPACDMINSAADGLFAGSLQPGDFKELLTSMPKCLLCQKLVDTRLAKLITDLLPSIAPEVLKTVIGRHTDIGPKTAAALGKAMAGET